MNVLLGINVSRPMGLDARQIKTCTIADDFAFVGSAFMFAGDNIREAVNAKKREVCGSNKQQTVVAGVANRRLK